MKIIIKTLQKMPKHTRGKPGAGYFLYVSLSLPSSNGVLRPTSFLPDDSAAPMQALDLRGGELISLQLKME